VSLARAELIADAGAAAADDQFFRSPRFLEAEGVTHSLRIESDEGELVGPLIVREIPGTDGRDATSPYGYPGLAWREGRGATPTAAGGGRGGWGVGGGGGPTPPGPGSLRWFWAWPAGAPPRPSHRRR